MTSEKIISLLPYSKPFLFVDSITDVNEVSITGNYRFKEDEFFYKGHFSANNGTSENYPVTPGVILIETMAQIGLVCFGIYLIKDELSKYKDKKIAMVSTQVDFFLPVFPGETVTVFSQKVYFRFGKLKCDIEMRNSKIELVCKGIISGMVKLQNDGK
jgi:3-hydroxyacyl-[acyl-carrier-protein] dehydratase